MTQTSRFHVGHQKKSGAFAQLAETVCYDFQSEPEPQPIENQFSCTESAIFENSVKL